jgi:hypothetical protein
MEPAHGTPHAVVDVHDHDHDDGLKDATAATAARVTVNTEPLQRLMQSLQSAESFPPPRQQKAAKRLGVRPSPSPSFAPGSRGGGGGGGGGTVKHAERVPHPRQRSDPSGYTSRDLLSSSQAYRSGFRWGGPAVGWVLPPTSTSGSNNAAAAAAADKGMYVF